MGLFRFVQDSCVCRCCVKDLLLINLIFTIAILFSGEEKKSPSPSDYMCKEISSTSGKWFT